MEIDKIPQETPIAQPPVENQPIHKKLLNQKGSFLLILGAVVIILVVLGAGGYLLMQKQNPEKPSSQIPTQQITPNSIDTTQTIKKDNPAIVALKDGDLYAIQMNDLSSKKLTTGGGFYTSNQYGYWFSPDHTKLVSKQGKTLLLITKENSKPILQTELKGDVNSVAWRTDSNALVIWQVLKSEETGIGLPTLSEILTYDLETGGASKIKEFNGGGSVVLWDKETNSIGYTTGGGEGGAFGTYHFLNINSQAEKKFDTVWSNPSFTPDGKEFIVYERIQDNKEGSIIKNINIYSVQNPDKPLRTFSIPFKQYVCAHRNTDFDSCLGEGKSIWFYDGSKIKSFNTQTNEITDVVTLPTVSVDVPNVGNIPGNVTILDITKDKKMALIEQQISFGKSEYKLFDLSNGQITSLGFTKGGTTQPQGQSNDASQFWTHEALGFLY